MKQKDLDALIMHAPDTASTDGYGERFYDQQDKIQEDKLKAHQNGVVYTPVACVDFINASVNELLKRHFGVTMDNPCVEILDPFAGTGIFLSRAIENELVDPERQKVQQIELMPDSAEIAKRNVEIAMDKAGKHGHVDTICADTFTLNPADEL